MHLIFGPEELSKSEEALEQFSTKLQKAIKEIRTSYDALVTRFENFLIEEFVGKKISFEQYKEVLQKRYINLKIHLLLPNQKTFIQRLNSKLDDKNAWLNSLCQAVIGNTLQNIQ